MASCIGCTTSLKPLTQAASQTGKPKSMLLTLPDRTDCFCGSVSKSQDPESGSISHYITPLPCEVPFISHFKDDRNTSRATYRSLEGLFFFIEFNFLLYMIISRHRRQQNPAPGIPVNFNGKKGFLKGYFRRKKGFKSEQKKRVFPRLI